MSQRAIQFANCADSFRQHITKLAGNCGKDPLEVYELWREYSESCRNFDQSPILFEFEQWYAEQLKPVEVQR